MKQVPVDIRVSQLLMWAHTTSVICSPGILLFKSSGEVWESGGGEIISNVQSTTDDGQHGVWALRFHFLCNQLVQPACGDLVNLVLLCLQQLDQVLHCRAKVTADWQLFQSQHQVSVTKETSSKMVTTLKDTELPYTLQTYSLLCAIFHII